MYQLNLSNQTIPFYARRSKVARRSDQTSVEKQIDRCQKWLVGEGATPVGFSDAKGHRSGRHEHTRPGWLAFKAHVMSHRPAAVVFYKLDRASRSVRDSAEFVEWCLANSVRLVSIIDRVDTGRNSTANEIARVHRLFVDAQEESELAKERSIDNISFLRENGVPWGYPSSGYKREGEGLDAKYVRDDEAPNIVQLIQWRIEGLSYRAVWRRANAEGLQHKNRNGELEPYNLGVVQSILNDPLTYAGYLKRKNFHAHRAITVLEGSGTYLERNARAWDAVKTPHIEALIDEDIANALIERNYKPKRTGRKPRTWCGMLQGILRYEGRGVYSQTRKDKHVYRTNGKGSRTFSADPIDAQVLDRLCAIHFNEDTRLMIKAHLSANDTTGDREAKRAQAQRLQGKLNRVKELYTDGVYTRAEFDAQFRAINDQIHELNQSLSVTSDADRLMVQLTTLGETLKLASPPLRKRAVGDVFQQIEITEGGEIARLEFVEWAGHAFIAINDAWLNSALDRCRVCNKATDESIAWLAEKRAA